MLSEQPAAVAVGAAWEYVCEAGSSGLGTWGAGANSREQVLLQAAFLEDVGFGYQCP